MTDEQWIDFFSKLLAIGIPAIAGAFGIMWNRSRNNRNRIDNQGEDIKVVKQDITEVKEGINDQLIEISVALKHQFEEDIKQLRQKIEEQDRRITETESALTYEKEKSAGLLKQLTADREMYQKQLEQKETQLQEQIEANKKLIGQIEDERKTSTELGNRYTILEDRFGEVERQMLDQTTVIKTYDRILANSGLIQASLQELKNRQIEEN